MRSSSTTQTTDYSAPPTQLIQVFETITNREQYAYSCTSYRAPSAPCGRYALDQSRIALSDQQFYSDGWGNERYLASDPQNPEFGASEDNTADYNLQDEPQDDPESLYPEVPRSF
jgi:hypothetical protein